MIFVAATGNILVCLAIATERSLRRIGNLFLASLAIADLFVSVLVMTFASVNDILGKNVLLIHIDDKFHSFRQQDIGYLVLNFAIHG